jgi:hypothetical protein
MNKHKLQIEKLERELAVLKAQTRDAMRQENTKIIDQVTHGMSLEEMQDLRDVLCLKISYQDDLDE